MWHGAPMFGPEEARLRREGVVVDCRRHSLAIGVAPQAIIPEAEFSARVPPDPARRAQQAHTSPGTMTGLKDVDVRRRRHRNQAVGIGLADAQFLRADSADRC